MATPATDSTRGLSAFRKNPITLFQDRVEGQRVAIGGSSAAPQFPVDFADYVLPVLALQVFCQPPKRNAHYIPVMQFAAEILLELQPDVVSAVQVFGPKPGRMRPEI